MNILGVFEYLHMYIIDNNMSGILSSFLLLKVFFLKIANPVYSKPKPST